MTKRPINNATKTAAKLEEARFFLLKIKENQQMFPDIQYYLSAFISSARSVLWIMRSEYQGEIGWEAWFDSLKPKAGSSEKKFIAVLNDIRVRLEKLEPLRVGVTMEIQVPKESFSEGEIKLLKKRSRQRLETIVTIFKKDSDLSGQKGIGKVEKVYFTIRDFPGKNAISIATKYFNLLSRIVKECEKKFEIKKTAYIPKN